MIVSPPALDIPGTSFEFGLGIFEGRPMGSLSVQEQVAQLSMVLDRMLSCPCLALIPIEELHRRRNNSSSR